LVEILGHSTDIETQSSNVKAVFALLVTKKIPLLQFVYMVQMQAVLLILFAWDRRWAVGGAFSLGDRFSGIFS
jgi:hypothetical protein